jgi:hypothetical protein
MRRKRADCVRSNLSVRANTRRSHLKIVGYRLNSIDLMSGHFL